MQSLNTATANEQHQSILLINGPNLNLLGVREPEIYGSTTLDDIETRLRKTAAHHHIELICIQSNHEGELVEAIQYHGLLALHPDKATNAANHYLDSPTNVNRATHGTVDAIIINPAAFTHTSVAIRDALLATSLPFVEVHLSNIHSREPFRTHSYFSDKADGVICGLGYLGYDMALTYLIEKYFK